MVLPVPDELLGNRLRAVISADAASDQGRGAGPLPSAAAGRTWSRTGWSSAEALPRTSTGKIDRAGLRGPETQEREEAGGN